MLILLPYGHDQLSFRRMPWVTIGVMAICVVVQVWLSLADYDARAEQAQEELKSQLLEHPHLTLSPEAEKLALSGLPKVVVDRIERYRVVTRQFRADPAKAAAAVRAYEAQEHVHDGAGDFANMVNAAIEQAGQRPGGMQQALAAQMLARDVVDTEVYAHLLKLGANGEAAEQKTLDESWRVVRSHPFVGYGFLPHKKLSLGLLTHQFLHGGWLHLIGNMIFLWLVGFNLEDRWGRAFFPLFYLAGGAVAALSHGAFAGLRHEDMPLIGASGAISAAMGAFLLHFARTQIQVFWLHFAMLVPRHGTFMMPAYLVLPAWLFNQLLSAWLNGDRSPVAYWAHIGGFAFGFGAALLLKLSGFESRFLLSRLKDVDVLYQAPPQLAEATAHLDAGRPADADRLLEPLLLARADDPEALPLRLRAKVALADGPGGVRAMTQALQAASKRNAGPTAKSWISEWSAQVPREGVNVDSWSRFGRALESAGLPEEALHEYTGLLRAHGITRDSAPSLIRYAELVLATGANRALAVKALDRALQTLGDDPAWSQRIKALHARASAA